MTDYIIDIVHCKRHVGPQHYVGRPSPLGNPFTALEHGRPKAIALYKTWLDLQWITNNSLVKDEIIRLGLILKRKKTITLSCWCAPKSCHAEIVGQALIGIINKNFI